MVRYPLLIALIWFLSGCDSEFDRCQAAQLDLLLTEEEFRKHVLAQTERRRAASSIGEFYNAQTALFGSLSSQLESGWEPAEFGYEFPERPESGDCYRFKCTSEQSVEWGIYVRSRDAVKTLREKWFERELLSAFNKAAKHAGFNDFYSMDAEYSKTLLVESDLFDYFWKLPGQLSNDAGQAQGCFNVRRKKELYLCQRFESLLVTARTWIDYQNTYVKDVKASLDYLDQVISEKEQELDRIKTRARANARDLCFVHANGESSVF